MVSMFHGRVTVFPRTSDLPGEELMTWCARHEISALPLGTWRNLFIFTEPCQNQSQQGEARRERAFEFALGLSNVRAWAFDERTGSTAHELGSHRHRRRR